MRMTLWRAALIAIALFLILFAVRFAYSLRPTIGRDSAPAHGVLHQQQSFGSVEFSRKNYASSTSDLAIAAAARPPSADQQKYEKIATLVQSSAKFDEDRKAVVSAIAVHDGIIQVERASGLKGRRSLYLGIGVPPGKFETFIAAAQAIGQGVQLEIVKNDKTNEYLQLKAKRTTLEKTRAALEGLASAGGSIDERVNVQSRLTDVEEKIQALGVSLGEFDTQNELCTIKLTLAERLPPTVPSLARRAFEALEWTAFVYAGVGIGFLALTAAFWLAAGLGGYVVRLVRSENASGGH